MNLHKITGKLAAFAAALVLAACSPATADSKPTAQPGTTSTQAPATPTLHPISGLAVIPLTVTTANGPRVLKVELAASAEEQEHGLMFRTAMGPDEGMIFPMNPPRRAAFWMRNTVIGLDIIFIGPDHKVLNIAANAVPYDETPLPSAGAASGVLELNAGRAAQIGLRPGDLVTW
ncbi:DUF192 domain-containing protein [Novosphingobium sp. FKTRR1]|uniref:DUF192 domain-containing protein n=1 Tax=Novosphingobium sp. FKTRR1 TaxID=2879118 RepID=UPI001CF03B52|nr:DUF192 domain-containing protein [Novosphingobium sp. FKTRR1]